MTITQAANELQAIRNDMASAAGYDRDALDARLAAVGLWIGRQTTFTKKLSQIATEAHQLADKLAGGSGRRGTKIEFVR